MSDRIPIIIPDVSFEEVESDLRKVFGSGQLTSGPFVVEFEKAIAEWTGV
jgi:dTDP-4-amino-4,6-dideoxygalactose transaminase